MAEEQPDLLREECRAVLNELLAWEKCMGGFDAPCWERARTFRDSLFPAEPRRRSIRVSFHKSGGEFDHRMLYPLVDAAVETAITEAANEMIRDDGGLTVGDTIIVTEDE